MYTILYKFKYNLFISARINKYTHCKKKKKGVYFSTLYKWNNYVFISGAFL